MNREGSLWSRQFTVCIAEILALHSRFKLHRDVEDLDRAMEHYKQVKNAYGLTSEYPEFIEIFKGKKTRANGANALIIQNFCTRNLS